MLTDNVTAALYAPSTGTVNPWELGIAAYENALKNGCRSRMNARVTAIQKTDHGYLVTIGSETLSCRAIVNCAGLSADWIQNLVYPGGTAIRMDGTDYLVMDPSIRTPKHIVFQESENGKGITVVPCVEGNLLLESPARPLEVPFASTREGMAFTQAAAAELLPDLDTDAVIRSFGAVRPNPHRADGSSIHDFCIEEPASNFISFIGIKTPGLTCSNELGQLAAEKIAETLSAEPNPDFDPHRQRISAGDHEIICQCRHITKGQILEAIRRGATTVDGVKRRVGSGMGPCQGSRCAWKIEKLLEEYGHGTL
jgi:glycerol-3-phosphate dehydrogenase